MWSCRRGSVLIATAVVTAATIAPAWAHHHPDHSCEGDAGVIGGGGSAVGECENEDPGPNPDPDPPPQCDPDSGEVAYYAKPPDEFSDHYTDLALHIEIPEGMAYLAAYNCAGVYLGGPHLVPDVTGPDPGVLRDRARARVVPPLPAPQVSPAEAVANVPTWLWVDPATWTVAAAVESVGGVTVEVEARPVATTWDLDEGSRSCSGPGIPWSEDAQEAYDAQPPAERGTGNPACTFVFHNSSTTRPDGVHHAAVSVTWEFAWSLNGVAQGTFGSVDRTTTFDLRVGEIQGLITS